MAAITVRLDNMAHGGEAMGRHEGQPILVSLGIPGELVRVVVDEKRRRFWRGHITEVLEPSPERVRLSELVRLRVGDVDLNRGTFKVLGKGSRERLVPFGAKVQASLWKYLHRFRPAPFHPNVGEVFLRSDGLPLTGNHVYRLVRRYGEAAGLEGVRCSPAEGRGSPREGEVGAAAPVWVRAAALASTRELRHNAPKGGRFRARAGGLCAEPSLRFWGSRSPPQPQTREVKLSASS